MRRPPLPFRSAGTECLPPMCHFFPAAYTGRASGPPKRPRCLLHSQIWVTEMTQGASVSDCSRKQKTLPFPLLSCTKPLRSILLSDLFTAVKLAGQSILRGGPHRRRGFSMRILTGASDSKAPPSWVTRSMCLLVTAPFCILILNNFSCIFNVCLLLSLLTKVDLNPSF